MNKYLILTAMASALVTSVMADSMSIAEEPLLKVYIGDTVIVAKDALNFCDLEKSEFNKKNGVNSVSGEKNGIQYERSVYLAGNEVRVGINVKIPCNVVDAVSYSLYIPKSSLTGARYEITGIKGKNFCGEVETAKNPGVKTCNYILFRNGGKSFAIDFNVNGRLAATDFQTRSSARIIFEKEYIIARLTRHNVKHGGLINFRLIIKNGEVPYKSIHRYAFSYKLTNPVMKYVNFSERAKDTVLTKPSTRDYDYMVKTRKRKTVNITVADRKPPKKVGVWSNPSALEFGINQPGNSVCDDYVASDRRETFQFSLPNGYYLASFYVHDGKNRKKLDFNVTVNGVRRKIEIADNLENIVLLPFEVRDGKCRINMEPGKTKWLLNGFSVIFLLGLKEDFIFQPFMPDEKLESFSQVIRETDK